MTSINKKINLQDFGYLLSLIYERSRPQEDRVGKLGEELCCVNIIIYLKNCKEDKGGILVKFTIDENESIFCATWND